MFALGCIQSLKCNTNRCPTGVTSQDPELMAGLVVGDKAERVLRYHQKTVHAALEIVGAIGLESPSEIKASHVFRRVSSTKVLSYEQQYPAIEVRARASAQRELWQRARPGSTEPRTIRPCLRSGLMCALPTRIDDPREMRRRAACSPAGAIRARRYKGGTKRGAFTCRLTRTTTSALRCASRRRH